MFKNLFVKKQKIDFESTNEMLELKKYWEIISVYKSNQSENEYLNAIKKQLKMLSPKEIIGFRLRTDYLLHVSYKSNLWCAAYIVNGGCSDDCFEYFRLWLISQGEEIFNDVTSKPDNLIKYISINDNGYEFELLWYVALDAFKENTGKELYDYISDDFPYGGEKYPPIEFNWNEDDPVSMKKICPNLMKKFNSK